MRQKNVELFSIILNEIKQNSQVTELFIAEKYEYSERTIRRYFKVLKDKNKIVLTNKNGKRNWKIL